jgi:dual-action HEIGH metallo-peptidase
MRIANQTNWNTRDIARLIRRCAELENVSLKYARVTVKNRRKGGWKLGHCQYGTLLNPRVRMLLLIPKESAVDSIQLAHVISHELGHAKGLRHTDMRNIRYGWVDGWKEYYGWATEYTIAVKPAPVQPSIEDRRAQRLVHARTMLRRAATRARRALTIEKKWKRRVTALCRAEAVIQV